MISEAREQLAAELAEAIPNVAVHTTWPDRFTPPCVLLVPPQGPYLTTAGYGGTYVLSLDLVVITARGSYDVVLPALESLVEQVLHHSADWSLGGVDAPSLVNVAGTEFLGTALHISKTVKEN